MNTPTPTATKQIDAPAVLCLGDTGSGKTYSISTLLELGLEVFFVCTEPQGLESLLQACEDKKIPLDKLHWVTVSPTRDGFDGLIKQAQKVTVMDFESLAKQRPTARTGAKFIEVLSALNDFVDERTGEAFGSVDKFGYDRVVVIDSLSGLNMMAMDAVIGDKLSAHQGEWGVAMNLLEKLINNLTSLSCMVVLTAHVERETNELTGAQQVMAAALGRKLAPRLPRFFSEVFLCHRDGDGYFWSTTAINVNLKTRVLPLAHKIPPDYKPIWESYERRVKHVSVNEERKTENVNG